MAEALTGEALKEAIRERFPTFAHLLDDPEILALLDTATNERKDITWVQARLEQTEYFRRTSSAIRTFDEEMVRDPASMDRRITEQQYLVVDTASRYGITLSPEIAKMLAVDALRQGLSEPEMLRLIGSYARQSIGAEAGNRTTSFDGELAGIVQGLQQQARDYHLVYDTKVLEEWAVQILEGRFSQEAATARFRQQATNLNPHLRPAVESGQTVEQYFEPLKQRAAQLLGMSPEAIDLTSERFSELTQHYDDQGNIRQMTNAELGRWARKQKEWWSTDAAIDLGYRTVNSILRTMGVM